MKIVQIFLLCLCLFVAVNGQTPQASPSPSVQPTAIERPATALQIDLIRADLDLKTSSIVGDSRKVIEAASKLGGLYGRAVNDPETVNWLLMNLFAEYAGDRSSARSAPQVSQVADEANVKFQMLIVAQNQALIEQNKRIIQLLEVIAKKPSR